MDCNDVDVRLDAGVRGRVDLGEADTLVVRHFISCVLMSGGVSLTRTKNKYRGEKGAMDEGRFGNTEVNNKAGGR